ncbi:hypothetical protein JHK86_014504 [Glycine max]|nr:hypothetical protein JHK86_014504 [Glycine max]
MYYTYVSWMYNTSGPLGFFYKIFFFLPFFNSSLPTYQSTITVLFLTLPDACNSWIVNEELKFYSPVQGHLFSQILNNKKLMHTKKCKKK